MAAGAASRVFRSGRDSTMATISLRASISRSRAVLPRRRDAHPGSATPAGILLGQCDQAGFFEDSQMLAEVPVGGTEGRLEVREVRALHAAEQREDSESNSLVNLVLQAVRRVRHPLGRGRSRYCRPALRSRRTANAAAWLAILRSPSAIAIASVQMPAMISASTRRNRLRAVTEKARKKPATTRNGPVLLMKVECNSKPDSRRDSAADGHRDRRSEPRPRRGLDPVALAAPPVVAGSCERGRRSARRRNRGRDGPCGRRERAVPPRRRSARSRRAGTRPSPSGCVPRPADDGHRRVPARATSGRTAIVSSLPPRCRLASLLHSVV